MCANLNIVPVLLHLAEIFGGRLQEASKQSSERSVILYL
jgi:hypothetical protein